VFAEDADTDSCLLPLSSLLQAMHSVRKDAHRRSKGSQGRLTLQTAWQDMQRHHARQWVVSPEQQAALDLIPGKMKNIFIGEKLKKKRRKKKRKKL
jgi:hypothetical protein